MGLFDKKYCDICGEKIGMLGNRKLEDGNMCKDCAKKLSPWFDGRRHSTVEEIKRQLDLREENLRMVEQFKPNKIIKSGCHNLYIDEAKQLFAVSINLGKEENPDLIRFDMVTGCNLDIQETCTEEYRTDNEGKRVSYNPPRYKYTYDYNVYIYLDHPFLDEIKAELNSFGISSNDPVRRHEADSAAQQMVGYLQRISGAGMNGMQNPGMMNQNDMYGGMPGQGMLNGGMNPNMGMQNPGMMNQNGMYGGMPGQGMPNGGMNPNMGMQNPAADNMAAAGNGQWKCPSCGMVNAGKFCEGCGTPRS